MTINRTRNLGDFKTTPYSSIRYQRDAVDVVLEGYGHNFPYWTNYRSITDVVGNRGGINPAESVNCASSVGALVGPFHDEHLALVSFIGDYFPGLPDVRQPNCDGLVPNISAASLSAWSAEAHGAFLDQVPAEFSVANFLYELKDIKGMIPKIQKSVSKTLSSNFLAFEFGIKPFIGDMEKIAGLLEAVEKRLKHLRATMGKTVSLKFDRKLEMPEIEFYRNPSPSPVSNFPTGIDLKFELRDFSGRFHIGAKLLQNLEGLSDHLTMLKALSAATGLNNPVAIVWEAIPFSFVVDWFFSLDKLISNISIQPFGGQYEISKVQWSCKRTFTYWVFECHWVPQVTKDLIGTIQITHYIRRNGFPASSAFITDFTLTPKQQMLSAALLNEFRK